MVWTCKMDEKRESKIVMQRGLLIILSGPSGVGKGTIRKYFETDERLNLAYSTSMTTRKPRAGEVDGRDYFFSTREDFEKAIQEGGLLERLAKASNEMKMVSQYKYIVCNDDPKLAAELIKTIILRHVELEENK